MRYIVGCDVIHDELVKVIPEGWRILKAIEISLPISENDPEGCVSKFAIVFEDEKHNLKLCEFTHSYAGVHLEEKHTSYYGLHDER